MKGVIIMTKQKFGLTGTALKTIALVLMVMDHIHYFFEFTGVVPEWFSMLARLSAPLFLFCTVEGFAHTHDRRRYFLRIWAIGTAMGTVEFFMIYAGAFRRGDGFYPMNAIFQDLMLLCIIWQGIDWLRQRRFVRGALAVAMPILWPFCIVALLTHRSALPCWRGSSPRRCLCGHPSPMAAGLFWPGASCCMHCTIISVCGWSFGRL
jgi:hypothetical protein